MKPNLGLEGGDDGSLRGSAAPARLQRAHGFVSGPVRDYPSREAGPFAPRGASTAGAHLGDGPVGAAADGAGRGAGGVGFFRFWRDAEVGEGRAFLNPVDERDDFLGGERFLAGGRHDVVVVFRQQDKADEITLEGIVGLDRGLAALTAFKRDLADVEAARG